MVTKDIIPRYSFTNKTSERTDIKAFGIKEMVLLLLSYFALQLTFSFNCVSCAK